ncbi:MAG TPA: hypothetical protein VHG08_08885 [Longimicrobium sp.]|nr:hypothetical protein [Longimicrobium sp.]
MHRVPAFILLIALLTGGCAPAGHPAPRFAEAEADSAAVMFPRVSPRSFVMQTWRPAHVSFIEIRPGSGEVAAWLNGAASRPMEAGRHAVPLQGGSSVRGRSAAARACSRPGELPFYDPALARTVASSADIREVTVRGRRVWCVRQPSASADDGRRERHVVILVSAQPVDDAVLEQARAAFNARYGGSPGEGGELSRTFSELVTPRWPGSVGYYLRIPVR